MITPTTYYADKEFIALPDMRAVTNKEPAVLVERLKEVGLTGIVYRSFFTGLPQYPELGRLFEKFLGYVDATNSLDVYLDLNGPWWVDKNYTYASPEAIQALLQRHHCIKGFIIDDYIWTRQHFEWLDDLDFSGQVHAVVYSDPRVNELEKVTELLTLKPRIHGLIDFVAVPSAGDETYVGLRDTSPIWRKRFPNLSYTAGIYCFVESNIPRRYEPLKREIENAHLHGPNAYMFWLLDWGIPEWQHCSTMFSDPLVPTKFEFIKSAVHSLKSVR